MQGITNFFNSINISSVQNVIGLISICIAGILAFLLLRKMEQIRELRNSLARLNRSFNDLDEQAKLIVKTDLDLNRTQEELDKRLEALNALQRTSRLISTTLDVDEIFRRLDRSLVAALGFEKSVILMLDKDRQFRCRVASGFSKKATEDIVSELFSDRALETSIKEGRILSSLSSPKQKKEKIQKLFKLEHFILTPILSQDGVIGILFAGNQSGNSVITEGDEELMLILSNQIGQSLENAQLFEKVYHSRQELESKIQDRTKELASALDEVQKISKAKSEFVSAVSHELRTPLTSIKGYASILISGKMGNIPDKVKERLEKINKHSDNLVKLINDLLDISRIESGRVEMKFKRQNISEIIESIRDLLVPQMKEKNINFKTEVPKDLPSLVIDSSQIERVFINLVSNAIKFTPEKGTIRISAQLKEDNVVVQITDTGIGIKPEDIEKLFEEFYRVDNEVNQIVKGTGLGLALVKNIIDAHQGKIWVTSEVNKGTSFHFSLPVSKESK